MQIQVMFHYITEELRAIRNQMASHQQRTYRMQGSKLKNIFLRTVHGALGGCISTWRYHASKEGTAAEIMTTQVQALSLECEGLMVENKELRRYKKLKEKEKGNIVVNGEAYAVLKEIISDLNGKSTSEELERARLQCVLALVAEHNRGEIDAELARIMRELNED